MSRIAKRNIPKRRSKPKAKLPEKNRNMPATVGLVLEVRDELKADVRALEAKMDSRFLALDSRFANIDSRFSSIDARFANIDARFAAQDSKFAAMDAKIEQILVSVHRTQAIVEEQRSENRVMLEALNGFVKRMDRIEQRQDEQDQTLRSLIRPAR